MAPHLPRVALDARSLRQALINLLVNAVQASKKAMQGPTRLNFGEGR